MEYKPLPIGTDDFKKLIENGCYYVDKSLWIKDLLDRKSEVSLFTRPRRFGKTLNLSMLRYFFEDTGSAERNEENRRLFDGLAIADAGGKYAESMQSYPVISLTLKSAKQGSFHMAYMMLKKEIAEEFSRHRKLILNSGEVSEAEKERFCNIVDLKAEEAHYADAVKFLSHCLYKATGKKSIILLDEYDVPLENAYYRGFYDEMVDFIRSLFESALKTNLNLEFAVITGCLRISRESIFTGLNNLDVVSILDQRYGEYFGFTQEEVRSMTEYYGTEERFDDLKKWYDGYLFGKTEVYNPWSVIKFQSDLTANPQALPRPYWSNTSSNSIVRDLIHNADETVKGELEALLSGGTITKPVHEDITYDEIYKTQDNLWNFLFFTGYLKKTGEVLDGRKIIVDLTIPNMEIQSIYEERIKSWFDEKAREKDLSPLHQALLSGDPETAQEELKKLLSESISYMDSAESFYHGFLLGVLVNIGNGYVVKSNREAGNGRFDICVYNRSDYLKPAAVIELKAVKRPRQMEEGAEAALLQIAEKRYDTWLADLGYEECWHVGIGFFRKKCAVKMEKCTIEEQPEEM